MKISQSIVGRWGGGHSHVTLPSDPCVCLNGAIQLWWNKTPACLSSVIIESKPCANMNAPFFHNSLFLRPLHGDVLQIAIVPSFCARSWTRFKRPWLFYLPSCCEEISSLMAFKTGSQTIKTEERECHFPPSPFSRRILYVVWGLVCSSAKMPTRQTDLI